MTAARRRVKVLFGNAKNHLLNAKGDLGRGLNWPDDEHRIARGECGSLIWGGHVEDITIGDISDLRRVTCGRCRRTALFKETTS